MAEPPLKFSPLTREEKDLALNIIGVALNLLDADFPAADRAELAGLPASYHADGGEFWKLTAKGTMIGTVGLRAGADGVWELKWLCLLPGWRRLGLGKMMAQNVLAHAKTKGIKQVRVSLPGGRPALFGLFSSLGFIGGKDYESVPPEKNCPLSLTF